MSWRAENFLCSRPTKKFYMADICRKGKLFYIVSFAVVSATEWHKQTLFFFNSFHIIFFWIIYRNFNWLMVTIGFFLMNSHNFILNFFVYNTRFNYMEIKIDWIEYQNVTFQVLWNDWSPGFYRKNIRFYSFNWLKKKYILRIHWSK